MTGAKNTKSTHTITVEMEFGASADEVLATLRARNIDVKGKTVRSRGILQDPDTNAILASEQRQQYVPSAADETAARNSARRRIVQTMRKAELRRARGVDIPVDALHAGSSLLSRVAAGEDVTAETTSYQASVEADTHASNVTRAEANRDRAQRQLVRRLARARSKLVQHHDTGGRITPGTWAAHQAALVAVGSGAADAGEQVQALEDALKESKGVTAVTRHQSAFEAKAAKIEHEINKARRAGVTAPGLNTLESGLAHARALYAQGGGSQDAAKNYLATGEMTDALKDTTRALREVTRPTRAHVLTLGERISYATALQRGVSGGVGAVFQGAQTAANMGGPVVGMGMSALGAGAQALQSLGFGRMVAGRAGGGALVAGGAALGAAVAGVGALSSAGASMREQATPKVASFQSVLGRNQLDGPNAADFVNSEADRILMGDFTVGMPSTGGSVNHRYLRPAQAQEERVRKMQHRWWMQAARKGRNGNELLGEIVRGGGGRRLSTNQLETAKDYALESGFSGTGFGAVAAYGEGGGFGYAARNLTRSSQSMGLDAEGGGAMVEDIGSLLAQRQAAGLGSDAVGTTNFQMRLAGAGVSPSRAMGAHRGYMSAQQGARQRLLGGFSGLMDSALLLRGLQAGGTPLDAATAIENDQPEDTLAYMRTQFGSMLTEASVRSSMGLRGGETKRLLAGDMSGLQGGITGVPEHATAMLLPELLREGNAILHADNSAQLEAMRKIDQTLDDIKGEMNGLARSFAGTR